MAESLLILAPGTSVAEVEATGQLRQRFGDRVVVIAGEPGALAGLGVLVADGETAPDPGPGFTETEAMGIHAWNARSEMAGKSRPGEGLAWDSPGFDAP